MKRLFTAALMICLLTACNTEKESSEPKYVTYSGTLTVTDAQGTVTHQTTNVLFEISEVNNIFSLEMNEVMFDPRMPKPFTIVITNLRGALINGTTVLESIVQPIVPLIGGTPYESFKIPLFTGTIGTRDLDIEFRCVNDKFHLDHTAVYKGKRIN